MTPDTAALRELADTYIEAPGILVSQDTVRALCDAADEVERLREVVEALPDDIALLKTPGALTAKIEDRAAEYHDSACRYQRATAAAEAKLDASRTAHAAIGAELRALCDEAHGRDMDHPDRCNVHEEDLRAVLDRHPPTTGATP